MTKFEEELNKKMDLKEVPMYFTQSGCSMTRKTYIETNWIFDNYKNWHSDEEFQELFDKYSNLNDNYEKEVVRSSKLEYQNIGLKSQLQQQALPVVPECVAEWIECVKGKNNNALALLDDDNMPDNVNEWLFFQRSDDNINLILRAWLDGYTVEKPQLFYLRDELTGQFLAKDNQFKDKDRYFFWTGADPLTHSIGTAWKLSFTQQEIDSMQTGSYEQIEVTE